jgi:2-polyprenyl-3-methyl-5-hydroxy-6-metoxy-1,4-benzoquinol methylase
MRNLLEKLGIIDAESVELHFPRVRDNANTKVLKCKKSGVIFLENSTVNELYYHSKVKTNDGITATPTLGANKISTPVNDDDSRRAKDFSGFVRGKDWLDYGTGRGGLVKLLKPVARSSCAFEINKSFVDDMRRDDIEVFDQLSALTDSRFDIVTMFHVLEHLLNPIETLAKLRTSLKAGGRIVVEVPHANDFLLKTLDLDAFKEFTFWSEHLILHTRNSLSMFLAEAGFKDIVIKGYQRYSLDNHLYWLRMAKPGGHDHWAHLTNEAIRSAYADMLCDLDQTDTLIAFAVK